MAFCIVEQINLLVMMGQPVLTGLSTCVTVTKTAMTVLMSFCQCVVPAKQTPLVVGTDQSVFTQVIYVMVRNIATTTQMSLLLNAKTAHSTIFLSVREVAKRFVVEKTTNVTVTKTATTTQTS